MKGAIDVWCNPFTPEGIKHLFIDNEEVHFMMGTQWGRTHHMVGYSVKDFVKQMDELGVEKVCIPALKQAFYRKNKMGGDFQYQDIAKVCAEAPDRVIGFFGINPFDGMAVFGVRPNERLFLLAHECNQQVPGTGKVQSYRYPGPRPGEGRPEVPVAGRKTGGARAS